MGLTIDDIPEEGREFFEEWKAARYKEMAPKGVDCSAAGQVQPQKELYPFQYHDAPEQVDEDEDECPHDEHDHYICLDCGKDIMDTIIDRADLLGND